MLETRFNMNLTITREQMLILNNALTTYMTNAVFAYNQDLTTEIGILQERFMECLTEVKEC